MTVPTALQADGTYATGDFHYGYNHAGQMISLTNPFGEETSWNYDPANGWLTSLTPVTETGDPTCTYYSYDSNGHLLSLVNTNNSGVGSSSYNGMQYDLEGNLTDVVTLDNISGQTYEKYSGTSHYTYDRSSQLTSQQWTYDSAHSATNHYYYNNSNKGDNLRAFNDSINPLYNYDNQRAAEFGKAAYDADGNPILYPVLNQGVPATFDAEGRLSSYNGGDALSEYNADGLREWKQTTSERTFFVYDGATPLLEMDNLGNVIATNTFGATGITSRRADFRGVVSSHYYEFDPSGNVINGRYLDHPQTGSTPDPVAIDPFGGPRSQEVFGFVGQGGAYRDDETGLVLMGFRYYDQETGRFLTRDPIGYAGGSNLYAYSGNNPVNYMDPMGLWRMTIFGDEYEFTGESWMDAGHAVAATVDGIIPFADPLTSIYSDACGNVDSSFLFSRAAGGVARDVLLAAFTPNLTQWVKNPILYEIGQKTLPFNDWKLLRHLSAIERGSAIVDFVGPLKALVPTLRLAEYGPTVGTGLTPSGYLLGNAVIHTTDAHWPAITAWVKHQWSRVR